MMKTPLALLLSAALALPIAGCSLFFGETKTSQGQLYQSGDTRYDPYFDTVHREQVAAAGWADQAKESRKPIVMALNLRPGASNATILTATRESKSGGVALGGPVEQTSAGEAERARKLTAELKRLEELKEQGEQLRKQAATDKENMGAQRADEKAVAKKDDIKRELGACVDVLDKLITDARRGAKEAEELSTKLTAAWTGRSEDEKTATKKDDDKKKPEPTAAKKPDAAAKPKPATPAKTDPPPAKPPAQPKPPDEVFNP
ncbi:MAG: hypothetical protein KIT84_06080 [Labilithrix sp.]|nr:hypothetical protein [Labilithrix sp.]MCW5810559.1 hypothetical protein [Labilithrix sp.]